MVTFVVVSSVLFTVLVAANSAAGIISEPILHAVMSSDAFECEDEACEDMEERGEESELDGSDDGDETLDTDWPGSFISDTAVLVSTFKAFCSNVDGT